MKRVSKIKKLVVASMFAALCCVATMVIQNAYKAQDDVDAFCADVAGLSVEELNEMEFGTTALIIMDLFEDAKSASFFKALSRFFSQVNSGSWICFTHGMQIH